MHKIKFLFFIALLLTGILSFYYISYNKIQELSWVNLSNRTTEKHRIAVFAAYSADGKIPNSTIYYLKELKKTVDGIVFISDNPIKKSEANKISPYVIMADFRRHGEYDFGSYKRGLKFLRDNQLLSEKDSLILLNDSCYGPVYPLSPILDEMDQKNVDFYGLASNSEFNYHLQSYFLVFRPTILKMTDLDRFLNQVKVQKDGWSVVLNYEITLTPYLQRLGYQSASFVPDQITVPDNRLHPFNKTFFPVLLMKEHHFPLIKKKAFVKESGFFKKLVDKPEQILEYLHQINSSLYDVIVSEVPLF